MTSEKILITGADGFIGSHLVETLVSLSACMDDTETPNIVLPEPKVEELLAEVRTAFKK